MAQVRSRLTAIDAVAGLAALALVCSGVLHLYQAPMHLDHSWEHGTILATVGAVDVAWALAWVRKRRPILMYAGIFLPVMTVVLYAISRFLPLPFEGQPEEVTALNLGTQLFEVAGFAAVLGVAAMLHRQARPVAITVAAAFVAAWAFYGAALLAAALMT